MNSDKFLIVTIDSTHLIMKIEKILLENNMNVRIIPLPTELNASCGFSIKADIEDAQKIETLLKENNIDRELYKFFICKKQGFKKEFSTYTF